MTSAVKASFLVLMFLLFAAGGESTSCFNCSSVNDNYCPEFMTSEDESIVPYVSCSPIYGARFCVKTTGVNGGSLGTTRYCSSRDMGNFCEYIRRPGDKLEYRSCIFTCSSHGCNSSLALKASLLPLFIILISSLQLITTIF